jgi:hypothetical protein
MYNLKFVRYGESFCSADFDRNKDLTVNVNLSHLVSYTDLKTFSLPHWKKSNKFYSIVSMVNGDKYIIREEEYLKLKEKFGDNDKQLLI